MMNDTVKTLNHIVDLHKEASHVHTYIDAYLEQIEEKDGQAKSDAHEALRISSDAIEATRLVAPSGGARPFVR